MPILNYGAKYQIKLKYFGLVDTLSLPGSAGLLPSTNPLTRLTNIMVQTCVSNGKNLKRIKNDKTCVFIKMEHFGSLHHTGVLFA